jgi:hypothetical protein
MTENFQKSLIFSLKSSVFFGIGVYLYSFLVSGVYFEMYKMGAGFTFLNFLYVAIGAFIAFVIAVFHLTWIILIARLIYLRISKKK